MNQSKLLFLLLLVAPFVLGYFIICALAALKPQIGIVLLMSALIALWSLYDPVQPFFVTLFLLPFERMTALFPPAAAGKATIMTTITIPKLMLGVIIVVWFTRAIVWKKTKPIMSLVATPLPMVVILSLVISWLSIIKAHHYGYFLHYETRIINNTVFFFLLINLIEDSPKFQKALKVICVSYIFIAFIGVYETITEKHILDFVGYPLPEAPFVEESERFRVAGPSGDPDYFGISMVLGFFITLMAAFVFTKSRTMKWVLLLLSSLYLFNIFGTASRGTILSLLAGMAVFWFSLKLRHKYLISGLTLIGFLAILGFYTATISDLTLSRYMGESGQLSIRYRIGWTKMGSKMAWKNPLLGIGTANFMREYNRYIDPLAPRTPRVGQNTYITILAENGLSGLIVYLAIYFISFINFHRAMRHSRDPTMRNISMTFLSITVVFAVFAGTLNTWVVEIYWMVFAFSVIMTKIGTVSSGKLDPP
jgi:O-antigen ligase